MIKDKKGYCFNDIQIVPVSISKINHREDINIITDGYLPLFTAPMSSVVSKENINNFEKHGIHGIIPRNESFDFRTNKLFNSKLWVAFSLNEFESLIVSDSFKTSLSPKILIDIANGHMEKIYDLVDKAKIINETLIVMIGNIANPDTYFQCMEHKIDYIRVGIGSGFGCITTTQTGIGYPQASLINEINMRKQVCANNQFFPKIVSDGGIRNYSDIIKALALGADYVMCGSIFSKMLESASICESSDGLVYDLKTVNNLNEIEKRKLISHKCIDLSKSYYGMSTKKAQLETGKKNLHTSEGTIKKIKVEYTMKQWVDNFSDYLRSAMSYCNAINLDEFIGKPDIITISQNAYNSINK